MGVDSRVVGYIYPVCWPYIPNMLYLYVQRIVSICPIHSLQYPFFNVIDYEILENNYMLSVLSVDSKRKSGSRQHPSCFETHGRRFENKRNRCCTKEFCSRIFYQHLFVALCIRFVETDYGRYNFPIYPTRLEGDENKGKRHQSGGPFHIGRRTRREEHDSFQ